MKILIRVACGALLLGLVSAGGCGKDPTKNPDFNQESLKNPSAIKMGADARPENARKP